MSGGFPAEEDACDLLVHPASAGPTPHQAPESAAPPCVHRGGQRIGTLMVPILIPPLSGQVDILAIS